MEMFQDTNESANAVSAEPSQAPRTEAGAVRAEYDRLRRGIALRSDTGITQFRISGPGALELVNRLVISDVARLPIRKMMSTLMLRPDGSVLADAYVVNRGGDYLLLADGGSPVELMDGIESGADQGPAVSMEDLSVRESLVSLDGPFSWELLKELLGMEILGLRYLEVMADREIAGVPVSVYRAGTTGEFGYWLGLPADRQPEVIGALMEAGRRYDLGTYGSKVHELAKLENRYLNPRREGAAARNPLELNGRIMVSRDKGDYVGRAAVEQALSSGPQRRLIGITVEPSPAGETAVPPIGAVVQHEDQQIGTVVNAGFSFTLGQPIALALMDVDHAYVGLDYAVGGTTARTVSAPFIFNRSLGIRFQEHSYFDQGQ